MALSRRTFLKSSVGGAAGLTIAGAVLKPAAASSPAVVWTDKMPINPDIDNMKVVCMHDPKMYGVPEGNTLTAIEKVVDKNVVNNNMDRMAMELTGKPTADTAWKTIFRSSKAWKDTKVMLKVNCVEKIMLARVSVIRKITDVLVGLGVDPKNIVMFDGQGMAYAQYNNFVSTTDATKIQAVLSNKMDSMGGRASATIPNVTGSGCPKDLIDGKTDIIVNIAVNKGHASPTFGIGLTTLCLKNHYGTFLETGGMASNLHNTNALFNINKIAPIVGGTPVRQQLCIIDSIWGAKDGPGVTNGCKFDNTPEGKPDRLIMGTFAGAVDYCCVKKIREPIQKATHTNDVVAKYLTSFGYTETDLKWTEITPTSVTTERVNALPQTQAVSFSLSHRSFRLSTINFSVPTGNTQSIRTRIFDMRGSIIHEIHSSAGAASIAWDGKTVGGTTIRAGNYVVELSAGSFRDTERLTLLR